MTFSLYCRFCDAHHTRLGADQTPDDSYMCERCAYAYEEGRAELDGHRDAANVLTEELQDAHQARELAERRTARWKALAKRYRGDAADWRAAFEASEQRTEAACRAFNVSEERVRERDVLLGELVEAVERFDGFDVDMMGSKGAAEAAERLSMLARLARERYAPFPKPDRSGVPG